MHTTYINISAHIKLIIPYKNYFVNTLFSFVPNKKINHIKLHKSTQIIQEKCFKIHEIASA